MVQYGTDPVYTQHTTVQQRGYDYDPALATGAAGAAYGGAPALARSAAAAPMQRTM